jgi:hypothetical protein
MPVSKPSTSRSVFLTKAVFMTGPSDWNPFPRVVLVTTSRGNDTIQRVISSSVTKRVTKSIVERSKMFQCRVRPGAD